MLFILWLIARLLTRLLVLPDADDGTKDLEILVLRHQLRVLRRKAGRPRFTAGDRVVLAAASRALPRQRWASFLVTPQTLLRWHRELVRRNWTYGKQRPPGRPPIDPQTTELILRMARDNARWGCLRICGELRKLGIRVAPPPSGRCCDATAWVRRHDAADRRGRSSCEPKPRGSSVATSSRWRRSGSRPSTCCSSSSSAPGASSPPE
jgi:hypothetical protein